MQVCKANLSMCKNSIISRYNLYMKKINYFHVYILIGIITNKRKGRVLK